MKHKHYDSIVAWANGAEIQYRDPYYREWQDTPDPAWNIHFDYRIKPKPPIVRYSFSKAWSLAQNTLHDVKATFDPETGDLLTIEKI